MTEEEEEALHNLPTSKLLRVISLFPHMREAIILELKRRGIQVVET